VIQCWCNMQDCLYHIKQTQAVQAIQAQLTKKID
jgi:hypothetical protein